MIRAMGVNCAPMARSPRLVADVNNGQFTRTRGRVHIDAIINAFAQ